jgi:hypothetical protein
MVVAKRQDERSTTRNQQLFGLRGGECNPGDGEKKSLNQIMLQKHVIRDSVVGTVTMRRIRRARVRMPAWAREFSLHQKYSHWLWAPEKLQSNMYRVTFPEIRLSGRDVRHLTPSSVDLKNEWSYNSTPHICFQDVDKVYITLKIRNIKTRKCEIWKNHEVCS